MNDFFSTFKQKAGPLPVWAWAGLGTIALALYLMRKKSQTANSTTAAANQTSTNLGSAAELANMFEVAGLMPYQGGNVYINETNGAPPTQGPKPPPPPKGPPPKPQGIYNITAADVKNNKGSSIGILNGIAKKYGVNPATLWAYNVAPGVRNPQTAAHLKAERAKGGNWLTAGESIVVPPKNWKP